MSLEPSWVWSELVAFFKDFPETLASPPGVSCPGIAEGSHRLRLAGTLDGPRPVPERLYGKAWRVTRRPATFHPVFEAPPRSSILKSPVVVLKSPAFRSFAREFSNSAGTTDKVHPPYRSKEEAGAIACSMRLVLPSCAIPNLRQAEPGPDLPARFHGATSLENSPQRGEKSFSMIRCLRD